MYRVTFTVQGTTPFPIDMLRYDRCTPRFEGDSQRIMNTFDDARPHRNIPIKVEVIKWSRTKADTKHAIAPRRWESFGWFVVDSHSEKV